MPDCDLLVIGAGAAGIAAARHALAAGRQVRVLEARGRAGGRAFTDAATLGLPFDLGAGWLHAAGRNPLVPLARDLGIALHDSDRLRRERSLVGDRPATAAELAAYGAAWSAFEARLGALAAAPGPDRAGGDAVPPGPWGATVAAWQGEVINAWPLAETSLRDLAANLLEGPNLLPAGGLGALLARLAGGVPVGYGARVERLRWGGAGGVVAEGAFGRLAARAAVVTLPTALLAAGAIRFDPPLPAGVRQAAHDLPLGQAVKVALRHEGGDRFGLPDDAALDRQVAPGEALLPLSLFPLGAPIAWGWIGGPLAREVEAEGPAAAEALVRAEIARQLGTRAPAAFRPGALVSGWGRDPFAGGAYSHARIGAAGARAALARPLAGGRLCLAGEACHPTLSGTVGGAWESGIAAARAALGVRAVPAG